MTVGSAEQPDAPDSGGDTSSPGASSGRGRVLTFAFAAFLAWNAGLGGRSLWRAVALVPNSSWHAALTLDEDERIHRWLKENEGRYSFRDGYPVELLELLEAQTPEDAVISIMGSIQDPSAGVFPFLQALLFPRFFQVLVDIPEGWPKTAADWDPRIHVLEFGPERGRELDGIFVKIAEGEDYDLWRCREEPP